LIVLSILTHQIKRGAAGRARLETHFSPARMVDETLALYERLVRVKSE
jgi:hypothetical protein